MPRFEWSKLDDLILFSLWAGLCVFYLWMGESQVASNLVSGLAGAMAMYLRGGAESKRID